MHYLLYNLKESGFVYTFGRDKQYRPIVIINIGKYNSDIVIKFIPR